MEKKKEREREEKDIQVIQINVCDQFPPIHLINDKTNIYL